MSIENMGMESQKDVLTVAQEKFGVNLNDDKAVKAKMHELQSNVAAVSELSNLWSDYQEQKEQRDAA